MSFMDYQQQRQIMVMTKGHPYGRDDFAGLFEELSDFSTCFVEQPASQAFFNPALAKDYDAFVLYDMPGLDFFSPQPPRYQYPPKSFRDNFLSLLEAGHGFVFLHHSIAAWPAWPEYAEIVGGKFLYKPDIVRDTRLTDSGYRHEVSHQLSIVKDHPVTAGIPRRFSMTDELYLGNVFDDSIEPLLVSDYDYSQENFYSAYRAVQGDMFCRQGWQHPKGSAVVGWLKHYKNSPIVYLQCGDNKAAYDNPNFKKLLFNAIRWVSSDDAKDWASRRHAESGKEASKSETFEAL